MNGIWRSLAGVYIWGGSGGDYGSIKFYTSPVAMEIGNVIYYLVMMD